MTLRDFGASCPIDQLGITHHIKDGLLRVGPPPDLTSATLTEEARNTLLLKEHATGSPEVVNVDNGCAPYLERIATALEKITEIALRWQRG